jgi:hypothetical protein
MLTLNTLILLRISLIRLSIAVSLLDELYRNKP